jgi:hypothetical protein
MRTTPVLLALLTQFVSSVARSASVAEPAKTFEVLSERCRTLTNEGDYKGALDACERAYPLKPEPWILAYVAQIHTALLHPVQARDALGRYLRSGQLSEENRKTAEAQVRYLETLFTTLLITTRVEGAEIRIDDQVMDASALARGTEVTVGAHRVTLQTKGATFTRFVFLRAGERTQIELPGSGVIALRCAIPQVRIFMDDQELDAAQASRGIPTPAGGHRVTFKVGTSTSSGQSVTVNPDERVSVWCTPPSADRPTMNPRGYWVTGMGLALGVAALATAIHNGNQYDEWETANGRLEGTRLPIEERIQLAHDNNERMESIQTTRAVAVGLGIASGLVTAGGVALLFADSHKPIENGSSSWVRKFAAGFTVSSALNSGAIAWRGAW